MLDHEQFWFDHLRAIDTSGSTTKAYAELHGLNVKKLYECQQPVHGRDGQTGGDDRASPLRGAVWCHSP